MKRTVCEWHSWPVAIVPLTRKVPVAVWFVTVPRAITVSADSPTFSEKRPWLVDPRARVGVDAERPDLAERLAHRRS